MVQIAAGVLFLLNKVFFALAEKNFGTEKERVWRIYAWLAYMLGLTPWLIIFAHENNWIAFCVEGGGGAPSMVLGLYIAWRGKGKEPAWLNLIAVLAVLLGCFISYESLGGFGELSQYLEFGLAVGFLGGTFLLAHQNANGYLFFVLMNGSNACLMYLQDYPMLMAQQVFSLIVMIYAYYLTVDRRVRKS